MFVNRLLVCMSGGRLVVRSVYHPKRVFVSCRVIKVYSDTENVEGCDGWSSKSIVITMFDKKNANNNVCLRKFTVLRIS